MPEVKDPISAERFRGMAVEAGFSPLEIERRLQTAITEGFVASGEPEEEPSAMRNFVAGFGSGLVEFGNTMFDAGLSQVPFGKQAGSAVKEFFGVESLADLANAIKLRGINDGSLEEGVAMSAGEGIGRYAPMLAVPGAAPGGIVRSLAGAAGGEIAADTAERAGAGEGTTALVGVLGDVASRNPVKTATALRRAPATLARGVRGGVNAAADRVLSPEAAEKFRSTGQGIRASTRAANRISPFKLSKAGAEEALTEGRRRLAGLENNSKREWAKVPEYMGEVSSDPMIAVAEKVRREFQADKQRIPAFVNDLLDASPRRKTVTLEYLQSVQRAITDASVDAGLDPKLRRTAQIARRMTEPVEKSLDMIARQGIGGQEAVRALRNAREATRVLRQEIPTNTRTYAHLMKAKGASASKVFEKILLGDDSLQEAQALMRATRTSRVAREGLRRAYFQSILGDVDASKNYGSTVMDRFNTTAESAQLILGEKGARRFETLIRELSRQRVRTLTNRSLFGAHMINALRGVGAGAAAGAVGAGTAGLPGALAGASLGLGASVVFQRMSPSQARLLAATALQDDTAWRLLQKRVKPGSEIKFLRKAEDVLARAVLRADKEREKEQEQ